jgi:hypothetical protein
MGGPDRKPYWDAAKSAADSYDKTILWLAGGTLALSAKYVTDNYGKVTPDWTLITGWSLLAGAVLLLLAALMCSQQACVVEYDRTDDDLENVWSTVAKILNWIILGAVSSGIFFVLYYFYRQLG